MSLESETAAYSPPRPRVLDRFQLGVGAGFAGDRFEPAVELIENVALDALVFECLAERTIGLAQLGLLTGRGPGFDPRIVRRIQATVQQARSSHTVLITNAGAADPRAAGEAIRQAAESLTGESCRVAVVTGDDILNRIDRRVPQSSVEDEVAQYGDRVVSANAYLGAAGIVEALEAEPHVIVTGRVADAALFLAPLIHRFGWGWDDYDILANGAVVGHLLECAGQLTGGYFADGRKKVIPGLATLGFPFAQVDAAGRAQLSKAPHTGGRIDRMTCTEQLFYEVTDPHAYITPDVSVDMTQVSIEEAVSVSSVSVHGARGAAPPETLKVSVGVRDGFTGVGEISYAGPGCLQRAKLAAEIIRERWDAVHEFGHIPLDAQVIGVNACRPWQEPKAGEQPQEVRLRLSVRTLERDAAITLPDEVESLYTNGPAGGGGVSTRVDEALGVISTTIPRSEVQQNIEVLE